MPRKVLITGPIPSVEETARELGVSPKRTREIVALMDAIVDRRLRAAARRKQRTKGAKAPQRASRTPTSAARP